MLTVGLTGGFATGKSTVAGWLSGVGCHVIQYDQLGHQVLEPGGEAYQPVIDAFGRGILQGDGTIDRAALGRRVFKDPDELERLSALVHPPAHARANALIEQFSRADPDGIVVVEAAILIETGTYRNYDRLIVVTCTPEQQRERGLARGLTLPQVEARLQRQLPLEEKAAHADFLIDTSGSLEAAQTQTNAVHLQLMDLSKSMAGNSTWGKANPRAHQRAEGDRSS